MEGAAEHDVARGAEGADVRRVVTASCTRGP